VLRRRWEVVKGEELARKASRSRCNRLKNVDIAARDKGVDIHRCLVEIGAPDWVRREARLAGVIGPRTLQPKLQPSRTHG
jgi:hypothetical protein